MLKTILVTNAFLLLSSVAFAAPNTMITCRCEQDLPDAEKEKVDLSKAKNLWAHGSKVVTIADGYASAAPGHNPGNLDKIAAANVGTAREKRVVKAACEMLKAQYCTDGKYAIDETNEKETSWIQTMNEKLKRIIFGEEQD